MSDPAPSLARVIVRNTVWTSLGTYANIVLGFASNLILTRLLPLEVFGYLTAGTFWTAQLGLRSKAGLTYAAIQQNTLDGDLLGTYWVTDLILAGVSLLLSSSAAAVLGVLGYPGPVVIAVVVLMLAECLPALTGALSMALEKELQVSYLTLLSLLASAGAYLVAIVMALRGAGVYSLLAINTVLALLGLVGMVLLCRWRLPQIFAWRWRFSRSLATSLLRRGLTTGLALTIVLGFVATYDNFLVGTFVGWDIAGLYDRAYKTAQWPNVLLSTVVGRIGFLTYAKVKDDPDRLRHAVRLSLWVLLTLGLPMGLCLAYGAPEVMAVLYDPRWLASSAYLPYIALYALSGLFWSVGFWLAVARADTRMTIILTVSQAILMLVVTTPLTRLWGVAGTLVGVGITLGVALLLSIRYVFRTVALNPVTTLGPAAVASGLTALALSGLHRWSLWIALPSLPRLIVIGCVGFVIFLTSLIALRPAEFRERLAYLQQAWRRP